ncbi:MAG: thiamine phosphate synthase [Janthinobacterium lividum]
MHVAALPSLYLITPAWRDQANDAPGAAGDADFTPFLERLGDALGTGIGLVQLRAKSLDVARYDALAAAVRDVCRGRATLILNGPTPYGADPPASDLRADGIHLSSARLMACQRRPVAPSCLVSAACHTLAELQQAARIGADFVTLSPVLPTRTHPDAPPLGWERFAERAAASPVPVYALGGMTRAHLARAQACGARGIAAISGLW